MTRKLAAALMASGALVAAVASAQRFDPRRARTLVVGAPSGPAPMDRVDARRSGCAPLPLPSGTLRIAWRRSLGMTIDRAPLVDGAGDVTVIATRGDVIVLDPEGNERAHTAVGASAVSGAALLSDGTVAFVTGAGEAVGVQLGAVRFRTRLGGDRAVAASRSAPLPLDDGGVVVSSATELVALDAEGNVRARASLRDPIAGPLVAALGKVVAVTAAGAVYAWAPGREPSRVGSFGGVVDGGVALEGDHTLVAIVDGSQLAELDLVRGVTSSRAVASGSGVAHFSGPPALRGTTATFFAVAAARTFVLTIDAAGQEVARQGVAVGALAPLPDGGAPAPSLEPHVGVLVDPRGVVAFASPDGQVGSISPGGALDVLGEQVCERGGGSGARGGSAGTAGASSARSGSVFAGIAPAGPAAFVVACESGVVAKVVEAFAGAGAGAGGAAGAPGGGVGRSP